MPYLSIWMWYNKKKNMDLYVFGYGESNYDIVLYLKGQGHGVITDKWIYLSQFMYVFLRRIVKTLLLIC